MDRTAPGNEVAPSTPIAEKPKTTASDGLIGDATSTATDLAEVLPNVGENDEEE